LSNNFANSKPYAKRLLPVNQGLSWDCLIKKTISQKSRDTVPLRCLSYLVFGFKAVLTDLKCSDLTVCDPYYILPILTSSTIYLQIYFAADGMNTNTMPDIMKKVSIYTEPWLKTVVRMRNPVLFYPKDPGSGSLSRLIIQFKFFPV
jgi:hypothetical protein